MTYKINLLFSFILIAICDKAFSQFQFDHYAIHNVNYIDVTDDQIIENQTIIIDEGLIAEIIDSDKYTENGKSV